MSKLTVEEELKALELEERKQALESKKIQDELARAQLDELRQKNDEAKRKKQIGAATVESANADRKRIQAMCNHHMGGQGASAIVNGQGDLRRDPSVGTQVLPNGVVVIHCVRCHKEWRTGDKDFKTGVELAQRTQTPPMICPQMPTVASAAR
jgi:hypothetical protein